MSSDIIESNNTEENKNVVTNEGRVSIPKEYEDKDENLIKTLKLLQEYSKDLALKYSAVTADINAINITLTKILKEIE